MAKWIAEIEGTDRTDVVLLESFQLQLEQPVSTASLTIKDTTIGLSISGLDEVVVRTSNLALQSETFEDGGVWLLFGISTVTADATTLPNGTDEADEVVESSAAGSQHFILQSFTDLADSTTYAWALTVKRGSGSRDLTMGMTGKDGAQTVVFVDLDDGSVLSGSPTVTALGSGWFRVEISRNVATGVSVPNVFVGLSIGTTGTYDGDGTSSIYVFGAQVEKASSVGAYSQVGAARARWRGLVVRRTYSRERNMLPGERNIVLECASHAWLARSQSDRISKAYTSDSDQNIVIDLVAQAGLDSTISATTATVDQTATGLTLAIGPNAKLRDALDLMAGLTGARYFIDHDLKLHWNLDTNSDAAPRDVDVDAAAAGEVRKVWGFEYEQDFASLINDVLVRGGDNGEGGNVEATASDGASQSSYGVFYDTREDSNWSEQSLVNELAAAIIADNKDPKERFRFETSLDYVWQPNQKVLLTAADYGLSAKELVIRRVGIEQKSADRTIYSIEGGDDLNTLTKLLARENSLKKVAAEVVKVLGIHAGTGDADGGNNADFDSLTEQSIGCWVYMTAAPNSEGTILQKSTGVTEGFLFVITSSRTLKFRSARTTTDTLVISSDTVPLNEWVHVMATVTNSGTGKLYINNTEVSYSTNQGTGSAAAGGSQVVRAAYFWQDGRAAITGLVASAAVFTAPQQAMLAASPFADPVAAGVSALIGWWLFDEFGDGVTATGTDTYLDGSGSANHMTPASTPLGVSRSYVP